VICVALLGCRDREVAELERVSDAVCACQTSKCAEAALKEVPQDEQRSTPRTQQLARRMLDCLAKLYDKERDQSEGSGSSDGS
jgi:hypothetical protein